MARRRHQGLSERQLKILDILENFQKKNGYPPSIREICEKTGISSTSVVNYYLDQLQEMGYIERDQGVSRGIRLLKPISESASSLMGLTQSGSASIRQTSRVFGEVINNLLKVPMLGRIVAGSPMPVPPSDFNYYDPESAVDIAASLLPSSEKNAQLFALEVQGDSMIDAMVNDGDIIIMKRAGEAHNGEMVSVWLKDRDETTLKYFYLEKGHVRLQPANPTMQPIYVDDPSIVEIQGKVVMVIRQMRSAVA